MRPFPNTGSSTLVERVSRRSQRPATKIFARRAAPVIVGLGTLGLTLATPTRAIAQMDETTPEAEKWFQDGLEQMKTGAYDAACPMIAESYRREPLLGVLFTLAECEAAWGKPATALEHYEAFLRAVAATELERRGTYDERREIATAQVAALSVSAPELTVDVAPNTPTDIWVRLNGKVVPATAYGVTQKVDPGEYSITAERGDHAVWQRRIRITGSGRARVEVRVAPPPSPLKSPIVETAPLEPENDHAKLTAAYFAGGIGLLGLAGGMVAGALALRDKQTVDENCPNHVCNAEGRRALDTARNEATLGTVGLTVAALGAATAGILWIAWPSSERQGSAQSTSWKGGLCTGSGNAQLTVSGAF